MTKICSGEAGFHCEGEHHGGKLYGRPRQEEQGLRRLHHKGAGHHDGGIVGKKRDPGILDPELFLAQIRKVEARLGKLAKIRKVETG